MPTLIGVTSNGASVELRERMDAAVRELERLGVEGFTAAPPLFRLLWRVGVDVRPPLFLPFGRFALLSGSFFAVGWFALRWLGRGGQLMGTVEFEVTLAIVTGAAFGILLAAYYRHRARSLQLPSWPVFVASLSGQ